MATQGHPILLDIGQGLSLMLGLPTIPIWNEERKPVTPKRGTLGFNTSSQKLEYWDGSSWYEASMSEA